MDYHWRKMTPDIIRKLGREIDKGITTEVQVVYLMVALRKLLEQKDAEQQYQYLKFHCDWALHSKLDRSAAQRVLKHFDAANVHFRSGAEVQALSREFDRVSKMEHFRQELYQFLEANGLPSLDANRSDGWTHFLHLYAQVIEDCPLVMTSENINSSISKVTLHVELANKPDEDEMFFKVIWTMMGKDGLSGDYFVVNSFSLNPR
jgi:hypothetical protein